LFNCYLLLIHILVFTSIYKVLYAPFHLTVLPSHNTGASIQFLFLWYILHPSTYFLTLLVTLGYQKFLITNSVVFHCPLSSSTSIVTNFIRPYLYQFFNDSHGLNGTQQPLKRPFNQYQSHL